MTFGEYLALKEEEERLELEIETDLSVESARQSTARMYKLQAAVETLCPELRNDPLKIFREYNRQMWGLSNGCEV